jgi:hypothetical protein
MNSCKVCLFANKCKGIKSIHRDESVKVCVMKAVGIFFFLSLKKQLCKTTSLFENTVVGHLRGLVGNINISFSKNVEIL